MVSPPKDDEPEFESISKSNDSCRNNIGITSKGQVFTWGKCSHLGKKKKCIGLVISIQFMYLIVIVFYLLPTKRTGQLGRPGKAAHILPALFSNPNHEDRISSERKTDSSSHIHVKASKAYTGGTKDAGHSAVIDSEGHLWLTGCDRWQQLGLGANANGASGYTWKNGRLWQESFQKNIHLLKLMKTGIRDVAIGGDHTVVLSENQRDVYSFGKGAEGQLGIVTKPFVSCPVRSKELSLSSARNVNGDAQKIGAVCAVRHCSFTLDENNNVLKRVGKCKMDKDLLLKAVRDCEEKSVRDALVLSKAPKPTENK